MKKIISLLAVALALPFLFSCNKENGNASNGAKPVTLIQGANFNLAKTYSSIKGTWTEGGETITTRTVVSTSSDGSFISWDQDEKEATKAVTITRKYNFQTGTYAVTVKDGKTTITLTLTEGQALGAIVVEESAGNVTVSFIPVDNAGNLNEEQKAEITIQSEANAGNQDEVYTNGTWIVSETIATARGLNFSRPGLDIHEIASWARENIGVEIKDEDLAELKGYKVKNIVITDSALSLNFENGKSFASNIDIKQYNGFKIENFVEDTGNNISDYINGTGRFDFSGDLCVLTISGSFKTNKESESTATSIILTLKRINK